MMGIKARVFRPVIHVSLEELVPADHFYRHLEQVLDLSFVREMVRGCYALGGRRSIDPVVFWKLYVPPNFLLNRSTRPAVSTNFCLPVKNGWHALQISTVIFGIVLRVVNVLPQAQCAVQV